MFFSWYFKNKNFKKRSNLSGQIAPFLLVVLVMLLVASIATINIGRVSLDKTETDNASDAAALAAASIQAGAFNWLAETNGLFRDNFDYFDAVFYALYEMAYDEWVTSLGLLLLSVAVSLAWVNSGYSVGGYLDCSLLTAVEAFIWGALDAVAAGLLLLAAMHIQKYTQLL